MKGIILAGGTGSRLGPLSKVTNKHLLPVGPVPMIYHPLSQLLENNITEICIVSGINHLDKIVSLLGSGSKFNCSFTYKVQDEAGGIAEALQLCENFAHFDDIAVFLGDNIFGKLLDLKLQPNTGAKFFLKQVKDPQRFGVAEVDHLKRLIDIEEKPLNPKSNLAVTGAYVYNILVWDVLKHIKRSKRGELEISDVNKRIMKVTFVDTQELHGWWSDAGTFKSLQESNIKVMSKLSKPLLKKIKQMIQVS